MNKIHWLILSAVVLVISSTTWALSSVTRYKTLTPKGVPANLSREAVLRIAAERALPTMRPASRAFIAQPTHDFGMMDPGRVKSHVFLIRNIGDELLVLGNPRESCRCAEAKLLQREIEPGATGGVSVSWNPGPDERELDITIRVPTSDPQQVELQLAIRGAVRQQLSASPDRLSFDAVVSDTAATRETLLTSQVWPAFTLDDIRSSLPGVAWEIVPASTKQLADAGALSGYVLRVTLPPGLPRGFIDETISFRAVPNDAQFSGESYTLPLEGVVKGLMSFYGPALRDGVIDLGTVRVGEEKRARLMVKIRSDEPILRNFRCETQPASIQATLTPHPDGVSGVYTLEVVVPRTAAPCAHLRDDQLGTLRVLTDEPHASEHSLRLRIAVVPRSVPPL